MKVGLLGKKLGMTRVYDEKGKSTPVTVVLADGNVLLQRKSLETDGYNAVKVGFDDQKPQRLSKAELGQFAKAGVGPKRLQKEFRVQDCSSEVVLGVEQFSVGDVVDVIGRSKGKGFQGIVRKHHAAGQPQSHGSMMHRRPGAIGMRSTPGRIWKNQSMPGHMGDKRVTVQNLVVVQVRVDEGVILVSGAVPGANGSYVVVRPAKKGLVA
ncbi:MAG: ribosomal protein [Verrucomicrobiota bacterium]|jgi:large subunit ribosomal protein L3